MKAHYKFSWVIELLKGGEKPFSHLKNNELYAQLWNEDAIVFNPEMEDSWPEAVKGLLVDIFVPATTRVKMEEVAKRCRSLIPEINPEAI